MSKRLIEVVESYRVDSEAEAEALIAEAKEDGEYELTKYNSEKKVKKSKGEIIDEGILVKLTKKYYSNFWETEE